MKRARDHDDAVLGIVTVPVSNLLPASDSQMETIACNDPDFRNDGFGPTLRNPMAVHKLTFASAIILQHDAAVAQFCKIDGFADRIFKRYRIQRNALTLATTHGGKTLCELLLRHSCDPHLFFTQTVEKDFYTSLVNSEAPRWSEIEFVTNMYKQLLDHELSHHTGMPSVICDLVAGFSSNFRVLLS